MVGSNGPGWVSSLGTVASLHAITISKWSPSIDQFNVPDEWCRRLESALISKRAVESGCRMRKQSMWTARKGFDLDGAQGLTVTWAWQSGGHEVVWKNSHVKQPRFPPPPCWKSIVLENYGYWDEERRD